MRLALLLCLLGAALAGTEGTDGSIYAAGFVQKDESFANRLHTDGETDAFISRTWPETGANWSVVLDSGDEDYAAPFVALDERADAFVAGATRGAFNESGSSNAGYFDLFVARLHAANGSVAWSTHVGTRMHETAQRVFYDARDASVFMLAHTYDVLDDAAHAGNSLRQGGGRDVALLKLDAASGARLWTRQFGTSLDDAALGLVLNGTSALLSGRADGGRFATGGAYNDAGIEVEPGVFSWGADAPFPQNLGRSRGFLWLAEFAAEDGALVDEWIDTGVSLSSHALTVSETGGNVSYEVVLCREPAAAVTVFPAPVQLTHSEEVYSTTEPVPQLAVWPEALTFSPANWAAPQLVTVAAVDDAVVEGTHYSAVTHATESDDVTYAAGRAPFLMGSNVSVSIADDDSALVEVSKLVTYVTEGGAQDGYDIRLTSQPASDVTVHAVGSSQATPAPDTIVFTAATWNETRTVTVTAVDDTASENAYGGTHAGGYIHHYVSSDDLVYDNRQPRCFYVPICDCGTLAASAAGYCSYDNTSTCSNATALTCDTDDWQEQELSAGGVPQACTNHVFGNGYCANVVLPDGKYSDPVLVIPPRFGADDPNPNPPNSTVESTGVGLEALEFKALEAYFDPDPMDWGRGFVREPHAAPHELTSPNPNRHPRAGDTVDELDLSGVPADVVSLLMGFLGVPTFDALEALAQDAFELKAAACTGVKRLTLHRWAWEEWPVGTAERMLAGAYRAFEHLDEGDLLGCGVATFNQTSSVMVVVADNDPAVTLSKRLLTTAEGGAQDNYTVVLNAPPGVASFASAAPMCDAPLVTHRQRPCEYADADPFQDQFQCYNASADAPCASEAPFPRAMRHALNVSELSSAAVTVSITGDGHVTTDPQQLVFTAANWHVPQTVTAVAVDDWVDEGRENRTLEHWVASGDDSRYDGDEVRVWAGPEPNANPAPFWGGRLDSSFNPHPDWDRAPRHFRLLATVVDDDSAGVRVSREQVLAAEEDPARAHSGALLRLALADAATVDPAAPDAVATAETLRVAHGGAQLLLRVDLPATPAAMAATEAVEVLLLKERDGQVEHQGLVSQEEGAAFARGATPVFDPVLVAHRGEVGGPDDGGGTLYRATIVEQAWASGNVTWASRPADDAALNASALVRVPTAVGATHALDLTPLARVAAAAGLPQLCVRLEGLRERRNDSLAYERHEAAVPVPAEPTNRDSDGLRASSEFAAAAAETAVRFVAAATNLALNGSASQSSTAANLTSGTALLAAGAAAARAIDGDTRGDVGAESVAVTLDEEQPFWDLDLGAVRSVGSVAVWPRQLPEAADHTAGYGYPWDHPNTRGALWSRERDRRAGTAGGAFWLLLADQPFPAAGGLEAARAVPHARRERFADPADGAVAVWAPEAAGRYLRVQLEGNGSLQLAEVAVFPAGSQPAPLGRLQLVGDRLASPYGRTRVRAWPAAADLARGRNATASSADPSSASPRVATDGDTLGLWDPAVPAAGVHAPGTATRSNLAYRYNDTFVHQAATLRTNEERDPWWEVDLGAAQAVGDAHVWLLQDGDVGAHASRWNPHACCAALDAPLSVLALGDAREVLANVTFAPDADPPRTLQAALNVAAARFVRVQLNGFARLNLAEVRVAPWEPRAAARYVLVELRGRYAAGRRLALPGLELLAEDGSVLHSSACSPVGDSSSSSQASVVLDLGAPVAIARAVANTSGCALPGDAVLPDRIGLAASLTDDDQQSFVDILPLSELSEGAWSLIDSDYVFAVERDAPVNHWRLGLADAALHYRSAGRTGQTGQAVLDVSGDDVDRWNHGFSLEAWFWLDRVERNATLLDAAGAARIGLDAAGRWSAGSVTGPAAVERQWTHVALAYDRVGMLLTLYVNGQREHVSTKINGEVVVELQHHYESASAPTASDAVLEPANVTISNNFTTVAEVAVFSAPLPQSRVLDHYQMGTGQGDAASYGVQLTAQPLSAVTVATARADGNVTVSPTALTFTPGNWNVSQTVTVRAVNDDVHERGVHAAVITHAVTSNATAKLVAGLNMTGMLERHNATAASMLQLVANLEDLDRLNNQLWDAEAAATNATLRAQSERWRRQLVEEAFLSLDGYSGAAAAAVEVLVTDNDAPGVNVSTERVFVKEGNYTDTYTLALATEPGADVTVHVHTDNDCVRDCGYPTDPPSCGDGLNGLAPGEAANPQTGFYGNAYWFNPDGNSTLFLCNVTAWPVNLTFTRANWALPQTVVVSAVDDNLDEGAPHNSTISHSAASADPAYDGLAIANTTASVTDNDFSAVQLAGAVVALAESAADGDTAGAYEVVLHSEPWSDVTVSVHADLYGECHRPCAGADVDGADCGEGTLVHEEISFATSATALRDTQLLTTFADVRSERQLIRTSVTYVEPVHRVSLSDDAAGTFTLSFGGAETAPIAADAAAADVDAALSALETVGAVIVERAAGNLTITLTGMPQGSSAHEFVANATGLTAGAVVGVAVLEQVNFVGGSFRVGIRETELSAWLPYDASADAVREALEGLEGVGDVRVLAFPLTASGDVEWQIEFLTNIGDMDPLVVASNLTGEGIAVAVETIQDGNTPGGSFTLLFGGTFVESVGVADPALGAHDVLDEMGGAPFARSNQTGQTTIEYRATRESWALPFNATADDVRDAIAALNLTAAPQVTREGHDCGFAGRCHSYTWTIEFADTPGDVPELAADAAGMTGDGVGVGVETAEEGNYITGEFFLTLASESETETTAALRANASAQEVNLALEALDMVSERHGDAHNDPKYGVTVTRLGPDMQGGYNWTAVFSALDSQEPLSLTVNASRLETSALRHYMFAQFDTKGNDQCAELDNRTVWVDHYCVHLPEAAVVRARALCNTTLSPRALTFSPTNWHLPQQVAVSSVDDALDEHTYDQFGTHVVHESLVAHTVSSDDYRFDQILVANATVQIVDDDVAEVLLSAANTTASEDGAAGNYSIWLATEPRFDVRVSAYNFYNGDGSMCYYIDMCNITVTPAVLTFTPSNWFEPQVVTAAAVDDPLDEWDVHTAVIDHAVNSDDRKYHRIEVPSVTAIVLDNDDSEVVVSNASVPMSEGADDAPGVYSVRLATEPFSRVTVSVAGDPSRGKGVVVDPETIVFSAFNWDSPQAVSVVAVDDAIAEGPHTSTVFHSAASADKIYDGIAVADVRADIGDNDNASVVLQLPGGNDTLYVAEARSGDAVNYTVALSSEPWQDVTVHVNDSLGCYREDLCNVTASPAALVFTIYNWATAQGVEVAAVDDALDEYDPHPAVLLHTASSGDGSYGSGIAIPAVPVSIDDDDVAGVSLTTASRPPHGMVVSEGGFSDSYTIVLDSEPFHNVKVTLETPFVFIRDALSPRRNATTRQVEFDGPTLYYNKWAVPPIPGDSFGITGVLEEDENLRNHTIFTPANWDVPQTVYVTAVEDGIFEGTDQNTTIDHLVESDDPYYNATAPIAPGEFLAAAQLVVEITESDTVPPPIATALAFSESGGQLLLTFDSDAYHAATTEFSIDPSTLEDVYTRVGGTFDCLWVFASGVDLLGSEPLCEWLSLAQLAVHLGAGATVEPGDELALHACGSYDSLGSCDDDFVVKARRSSQLVSEGVPAVSVPDDIVLPEGLLVAPDVVGSCSALAVDASGSTGGAGRALAYAWSFYPGAERARAENETASDFADRVAAEQAELDAAVAEYCADGQTWFWEDSDDDPDPANNTILYGMRTLCRVAEAVGLAGADSHAIELPVGSFVGATEYTFLVAIENFLGGAGDALVTVRSLASPLPSITRDGSATRDALRADGVFVETTAAIACPDEVGGVGMSFRWEQLVATSDGLDLAALNTAANARNLRIAPDVLTPGETYEMEVTVTMDELPEASATAQVAVSVGYADVVAAFAGGEERSVGALDGVLLDAASASYDPDEAPVEASFVFSCSSGSCVDAAGVSLVIDDASDGVLDLTNRTLVAGQELVFEVEYTAACAACEYPPFERDETDRCPGAPVLPGLPESDPLEPPCAVPTRSATASVTVLVVDDAVPSVALLDGAAAGRVNADDAVRLVGSVEWAGEDADPLASTLWVQEEGTLDMGDSALFSRPLSELALYIVPGALTAGGSYTFALTATTESGRVGEARLSVSVNTPPSLGSVSVAPASGLSARTVFQIQCLDWTDSADDLPLRYDFSTEATGALSMRRLSPQLDAYLPVGAGANHTVTVLVDVVDQLGAAARASAAVASLPSSADDVQRALDFVQNQTLTALALAVEAGDSVAGMQLVGSLGSLLNDVEPEWAAGTGGCPVETWSGLECSGNGWCSGAAGGCSCAAGWSGEACGLSDAHVAARTESRAALVAAMAEALPLLELDDDAVLLQVARTAAQLASEPAELAPAAQLELVGALRAVVNGSSAALDSEAAAAVLDGLGLVQAAGSSGGGARRRRRLSDGDGEWAEALELSLDVAREAALRLVSGALPAQPAVDAVGADVRARVVRDYRLAMDGRALGVPGLGWVPFSLRDAEAAAAAASNSTALDEQQVDAVALSWARDPHVWHNSSAALFSDVLSLSLHDVADDGRALSLPELEVTVELGHRWSNAQANLTDECRQWDAAAGAWAADGCRKSGAASEGNTTTCVCTSLYRTEFALFLVDFSQVVVPPAGPVPIADPRGEIPRTTLAVVFLLYAVGVWAGHRRDNAQASEAEDARLANAIKQNGIQRSAVRTLLSVIHRKRHLSAEEAAVEIQRFVRRRLLGQAVDDGRADRPSKAAVLRYAAQVRASMKRQQVALGDAVRNVWTTQERALENARDEAEAKAERQASLEKQRTMTKAAAQDLEAAQRGGHLRQKMPTRGYRERHVEAVRPGAGGDTVVRRHRRRVSVLSLARAKDKGKYAIRIALIVASGVQLLAAAIALAVGFDLALAEGYVEHYAVESIFMGDVGAAVAAVGFLLAVLTPGTVWASVREHRQTLRALVVLLCVAQMMVIAVIMVVANMAFDYREYPDANTDVIDSWAAQSTQVRDDVQVEYGCCGWSRLEDNPVEPCPEEALELSRSCQELVIPDAVDTLEAVMWSLVGGVFVVLATTVCAFLLIVRKEIEELEVRFKVMLSRSTLTMRRAFGVCSRSLAVVGTLLLLVALDFITSAGYVALGPVTSLFALELGYPLLMAAISILALSGLGTWASQHFRGSTMVVFAVVAGSLLLGDLVLGAVARKMGGDLDTYPNVDEWLEDRWRVLSRDLQYEAQHAFVCCGFRDPAAVAAYDREELCPVAGYDTACRGALGRRAADLLMGIFYLSVALGAAIAAPLALNFALMLQQGLWPPPESAVAKEERMAHLRITDPFLADREGVVTRRIMAALAVANCLFVVGGAVMLGAGLDILYAGGYVGHEVVTEVFFRDRVGWLLAMGALVFATALLGLQGALRRHKGYLFVYLCLLLAALFGALLGGAVAWRAHTSERAFRRVDAAVEEAWAELPRDSKELAQEALQCCGYDDEFSHPFTVFVSENESWVPSCPVNATVGCRDALFDHAVGLSGTLLGTGVAAMLLLSGSVLLSCLVFHRQGPVKRQVSRALMQLKAGQLAACAGGLLAGAALLTLGVDLLSATGFFVGGPVAVFYGAGMGGAALFLWLSLSSSSLVGLWGALYHHLGCQMAYASMSAALSVAASTVAGLAAGASSTDVAAALDAAWSGASAGERADAEDLLLCCGFDAPAGNGSALDRPGGGGLCPGNESAWEWSGAADAYVPGCRSPFVAEVQGFLDPLGYTLVVLVLCAAAAAGVALLVVREIRRAAPWEWSKYLFRLQSEWRRYGRELHRQHTLASQPFVQDVRYSRPQRLSALLVAAMGSLAVVSVAFSSSSSESAEDQSQLGVGALAAVLAFPAYMGTVLMFEAVARRRPRETAKAALERKRQERVMTNRALPSGLRAWLRMEPEERAELFLALCRRVALAYNVARALAGLVAIALGIGIAAGGVDRFRFLGAQWEGVLLALVVCVGAAGVATSLLGLYGVGSMEQFPAAGRAALRWHAVLLALGVAALAALGTVALVMTTGAGTAESLERDTGLSVAGVAADAWGDMGAAARAAWQDAEECCGLSDMLDAPELPCPNVTARVVTTTGGGAEETGLEVVAELGGCYASLRAWASDTVHGAGVALLVAAGLDLLLALWPATMIVGSLSDPLAQVRPVGVEHDAEHLQAQQRKLQRRPSVTEVVRSLTSSPSGAGAGGNRRNRGRRRSSLQAEYLGRRDSFVDTGFYADRLRGVLQTRRFQDVTFKREQRLKRELAPGQRDVRSYESLLPWWALYVAHALVGAWTAAMLLVALPYSVELEGAAARAWLGAFCAALTVHLVLLEPLGVLAKEVAGPAAAAALRGSFAWRLGSFAAQSALAARLAGEAAKDVPKWAQYDLFPMFSVRQHAAELIQRRWRAKIFRRQFAMLLQEARKEAREKKRVHRLECVRSAWQAFSEEEIDAFRLLFLSFDTDRSGTVSIHELATACRRMGRPMPRTKLATLMQEVDVEESGELDFGEFLFVISAIGTGASHALLQDAADKALSDTAAGRPTAMGLVDIMAARARQGLPAAASSGQVAAEHAQNLAAVPSTAEVRRAGGRVRPKGAQLLHHTRLPPVVAAQQAPGEATMSRAARQIVAAVHKRDQAKNKERRRKLLRGRSRPVRVKPAPLDEAVDEAVRVLSGVQGSWGVPSAAPAGGGASEVAGGGGGGASEVAGGPPLSADDVAGGPPLELVAASVVDLTAGGDLAATAEAEVVYLAEAEAAAEVEAETEVVDLAAAEAAAEVEVVDLTAAEAAAGVGSGDEAEAEADAETAAAVDE